MTDTDITALIERLRDMRPAFDGFEAAQRLEAADALEALQERVHYAEGVADTNIARANEAEAERDGIRLDLNDCNNERVSWKARSEKAEQRVAELEARL